MSPFFYLPFFFMKIISFSLAILFVSVSLRSQPFSRADVQANLASIVNTNGVGVADYDADGDLDLFFTGIKNFNPADPSTWSHLMRNNSDGTFTDVTVEAGFGIQYINEGLKAERGEKMGASWGDYDNDGYPDIFLANSRLDQLYHNNGDGTFTDVTAQAGVEGCNVCYSSTGLWWDHDRDGDLDLFVSVLNNENFMYQNNGDGTFSNITEASGLAGKNTITWASVAIDAGRDNILDLYNLNDTQPNEFFENRSGQKYNEAALAYRIADEGASMGIAIGDCNNDGLFDMYVTNIYNHLPNPLFIDQGNRRYSNKAKLFGVDNTGWGWGTTFIDFDHDGDEDLAAVNGPIDKLYGVIQPDIDNFFFKNMLVEESMRFEDISQTSGFVGKAKSKGLEAFDYDADGDLDLVVANMEEGVYFFENATAQHENPGTHNWLQIKLRGSTSNRDGFGTTVKIRMGDTWLHRYHHGAAIFGHSIKPVHFGVGEVQMIDEIRFTWLTGITEAIYNVPVNQIFQFVEGSGEMLEEQQDTTPSGGAILEKHFAHPNPFVGETMFRFELATEGILDVKVYSPLGHLVYQTSQPVLEPGIMEIPWNATNMSSGMYFYTAQINNKKLRGRTLKLDTN
jgi:FG-GAP-like repeat/ASPIC and UnbV